MIQATTVRRVVMGAFAVSMLVLAVVLGACGSGASPEESPRQATDREADDVAPQTGEPSEESDEVGEMTLTTSAYEPAGEIPAIYARPGVDGGANVSIPFEWSGAPSETRSFAFVLVDLHPIANEWIHWAVVDIAPDTVAMPEGASRIEMPEGARELDSTWGGPGYEGPEPPRGSGRHEYRATVYALDLPSLEIAQNPDHAAFLAAIETHVLAQGSMSGFYER